jgi:hypothetical protein
MLSNPFQLVRLVGRDPAVVTKLLLFGVLTAASFAFTPLIVGLIGWAVLLGAQVHMIERVRAKDPRPLPIFRTGDDFARPLNRGVVPLIVFLAYNIPNVLIAFTQTATAEVGGGTTIGGGLTLVLLCCLVPVLLVYNAVWLPFFTIGMARYAETRRWDAFFAYPALWAVIAPAFGQTAVFVAWAFALVVLIGVLAAIPCLGWAVFALLLIPATGLLGAAYAAAVLDGAGANSRTAR